MMVFQKGKVNKRRRFNVNITIQYRGRVRADDC